MEGGFVGFFVGAAGVKECASRAVQHFSWNILDHFDIQTLTSSKSCLDSGQRDLGKTQGKHRSRAGEDAHRRAQRLCEDIGRSCSCSLLSIIHYCLGVQANVIKLAPHQTKPKCKSSVYISAPNAVRKLNAQT